MDDYNFFIRIIVAKRSKKIKFSPYFILIDHFLSDKACRRIQNRSNRDYALYC